MEENNDPIKEANDNSKKQTTKKLKNVKKGETSNGRGSYKGNVRKVSEKSSTAGTPIDKDLERIKKITIIVMGIFVLIAIYIFSSNILKDLIGAFNSDIVEEVRSEEGYDFNEILNN